MLQCQRDSKDSTSGMREARERAGGEEDEEKEEEEDGGGEDAAAEAGRGENGEMVDDKEERLRSFRAVGGR